MSKRPWKKYLGVAAILLTLALVANPELRALLLVSESLGLEAVALLVLAQLRMVFLPLIAVVIGRAAELACAGPALLGGGAGRALVFVLPLRPLAVLLCPLLYLVLAMAQRCLATPFGADRDAGTSQIHLGFNGNPSQR